MKNMTREDFKALFNLNEGDEALVQADSFHELEVTWFDIARDMIAQMDSMLTRK